VILPAVIACLAFGWGFFHLYLAASISRNAADQAQVRLATLFAAIENDMHGDGPLPSERLVGDDRWARVLAHWRQASADGDQLLLIDRDGRVLADRSRKQTAPSSVDRIGQSLSLTHATAQWGDFDGAIHGGLDDLATGVELVAVAHPLPARDGYIVVAAPGSEKVDRAALSKSIWTAETIAFIWTAGLAAVTLHLLLHRARQPAADQPKFDVEALRQAQALVRAQETVIFGLAKLSDSRDSDTGMHLERIAQFSSMLATGLRQRADFRDRITPGFIQLIGISSALHDIGKVGVEDSILRKPGTLTADERSRMQRHAEIGADCLREIERRLGPTNFLQMAREIVSAHHEWWNGQGYPHGLSGEQIPLSARIVAVADVYDALRSKRVYKDALPHEECVRVIAGAAGTQFDPRVVEVFLQIEERIGQLADQLHAQEQSNSSGDEMTADNEPQPGEEHVSII
jgi:HD-GYP domain-containing protein (c-di-GMP phosphodiesterase class II)